MPRKMREGKQRRETSLTFEDIGLDERARWNLGIVLIRGEFTPVQFPGGSQPRLWPSWKAWAASYRNVRAQYLAGFYERHQQDEMPGAELLYAAYERGEDPGEVEVPKPVDPRYLLAAPIKR
jgi:hypothetical protein